MREELKIVYQHYIPDDLITEFEKLGLERQLNVEIKKIRTEQRFYNYTGPEISDIVIYIKQNTTELLVKGLLVELASAALIGGIKLLWIGLSKLAIKKLQSGGKQTDKPKSISINLIDKDREVKIILEGEVDEQKVEKIISESFKFMKSEKLDKAFNNPDNIPEEKTKTIQLIYNKEKQVWETENFGENRRQREATQKWGEENLGL